MSKIDSEIDQISETLEKAAKTGEGSRGGKVIGHTQSGKPIYENSSLKSEKRKSGPNGWDEMKAAEAQNEKSMSESHAHFNREDHEDAHAAHKKAAEEASDTRSKNKHSLHAEHHSRMGREKTEGMIPGMDEGAWKHHHGEATKEKADAESRLKNKKWMDSASDMSKKWAHETNKKTINHIARDNHDYHKMRAHGESFIGPIDAPAREKWEKITGKEVKPENTWKYDHTVHHTSASEDKAGWKSNLTGEKLKSAKDMWPHLREKKEKKPMKKSIETLLETVKAMGPEALKKAIPTLSEEQRELLKEVLAKGKQPVSMDAEQPKEQMLVELAQEKKKNSKPRAGEADEDMVKEEADSIQHQGDHSPEGLEGQVIKAMPQEEAPAPQPLEPKMEMKDAKPSELADRMKARGMKKEDAMAKLRERGHHDMAEEMDKCWDMKKALADLEPAELDEHKTALKVKADAEHKASEIKAVAHAEEKVATPKMQKPIVWGEGTERLLKASTRRGQNSHYTVESTILEEDASTKEVLKKGGYLNEGEPMAKSTTQKIDINDMIENKQDYAQDQIERIQGLAKAAKSGPFTVASFDQETIAKAFPMGAEPMGSPMPGASDESQHIGRTDSGRPVHKDSYMRSEDFQDEDHKDAAKLHKSRADDMHAMMRDSSKMEHEKADLEPKRDFHDLSAEYHDSKACGKHDLAKCYRDQLDKCWMK